MESTPDHDGAPRELRLEGWMLGAAAAVLLLALVGAFWVGRWFERTTAPAVRSSDSVTAESAAGVLSSVDTTEDANVFDRVGEDAARPEPGREMTREPAPAAAAPPLAPAEDTSQAAGPWWVQVFAGRDRQSADELARKLRGRGWPVAVHAEREGSGALYKVRVGGYAERTEADRAAGSLRDSGEPRAWVVRVE